jgi:hypothetical protein
MPMWRTLKAWIIIRNGNEMRLVRNRPRLRVNEVAVEVTVRAPEPPRIVGSVTIELPEPPPATATAAAAEYGELGEEADPAGPDE